MNITVAIYERKFGSWLEWTTVGLGAHTCDGEGRSAIKLQKALSTELKAELRELDPAKLTEFSLPRGLSLRRVRLDLTLRGEKSKRKITGNYPVILEPRWFSDEQRQVIAYHPLRQKELEWFPFDEQRPLDEQAALYFARTWAKLEDDELDELETNRKDRLKVFSFTARTKGLLDQLPNRKQGIWDDLEVKPKRKKKKKKKRPFKVLGSIGIDQTIRAADGALVAGMPRSPYREQLQQLLCGSARQPVIVVGPPGVGKTTLIQRWVRDQLTADDYDSHRNLDRVHHVWAVAGKRIIAGMTYLGDWEQRCIDLLDDVVSNRVILWVEDLHHFGRIGRTRDSDRNLAEFFRGAVARKQLLIVGECTAEQLQRLEDDAPSFAALFSRVQVAPTSDADTLRMMMHGARELELPNRVGFDPFTYRAILELGPSLFPGSAAPGVTIDLLRELARRAAKLDSEISGDRKDTSAPVALTPRHVVALLSSKTGLPDLLLQPNKRLDPSALEAEFSQQVIGQPRAIAAAVDVIMRIRAGLTEPRRPYAVYLLTGPTGTGKTELSKCFAEYIYGDASRLLRFDMSEFSGPDAAARLIGDRFDPVGRLTAAVQQQPFCVVLLDEIEKAHPSVFNLLLQLFDEGRLTDAAGGVAHFSHAVVLMTSNLGARVSDAAGFTERDDDAVAEMVRAVEDFFPPELFNRIDRVVPFSVLSNEAARLIAAKELAKLLSRWGLTERNIFVRSGEEALSQIVEQGFDARYGARTVKRFLDQQVGSLLAEAIASSAPAALRVFHLYCRDGSFRLHVEALAEAPPLDARYAIEPLLEEGPAQMKERLPATMDLLDELLGSEALEKVSQQLSYHLEQHQLGSAEDHADMVYELESMRMQLQHLRRRVGYLLARKSPDRLQMLESLATVEFFRRALRQVHDPQQHAVLIKLTNVGLARQKGRFRQQSSSLLGSIAEACARCDRGEVESFAARLPDRTARDGGGADELDGALTLQPEMIVLKMVGLCVLDYFEGETGCHVWRSLTRGAEIVRVEVRAAEPKATALDALREHDRGVERFAASLGETTGGNLPPNPEGLLPTIRELRFTPPTGRQSAPLQIEDYQLGYAETLNVRSIAEALPHLWMLRMSRTH